MKRFIMLSSVIFLMAGSLLVQAGPIHGDSTLDLRAQTKAGVNGLHLIEGELHAATTLFARNPEPGAAKPSADNKALQEGIPGGILVKDKFTLLLVDGRVLAKLRSAMPKRENAIRVYGIVHDRGRSLTPLRIEYRKEGEWLTFDLPASGTLSSGVQGGDE